jgi:hypothetical protein
VTCTNLAEVLFLKGGQIEINTTLFSKGSPTTGLAVIHSESKHEKFGNIGRDRVKRGG